VLRRCDGSGWRSALDALILDSFEKADRDIRGFSALFQLVAMAGKCRTPKSCIPSVLIDDNVECGGGRLADGVKMGLDEGQVPYCLSIKQSNLDCLMERQ
jgi:hypothetical protein